MALFKKLADAVRKPLKAVTKPVARVTEKILKPVVKPLRPVAAALAPLVNPMALFVQPKALGIKNQNSAAIFDKSQQVSRIVAATVATAGVAKVVAPALLATAKTLGVGATVATVKETGEAIGLDDAGAIMDMAKPLINGGASIRAATLANDRMNANEMGLTAEFQRSMMREGPGSVPVWAWVAGSVLLFFILFLAVRR